MTTVYVTSTAKITEWSPYARSNYERIMRAAEHNSIGNHSLVDNPSDAEIILFVEAGSPYHRDILQSDLYKRFRERCFVFDFLDNALPLLPGIYLGIPPHLLHIPIYQFGFYPRVFDNRMLDAFSPHTECELLFSFIGRVANYERVRRPVVQLRHPRALLADRSSGQSDKDDDYVYVLKKSKFVICPRGIGPSTWRLFETMKAGRAPVIIADDWIPPRGLQWDEFSIRIPENEIESIPSIMESVEHNAEEMGLRARAAWRNSFSLESSFNWLVERCLEIRAHIATHQRYISRNRIPELGRERVIGYVKDYIRVRWL